MKKHPAPLLSESSILRYFLYAHASSPGQTPVSYYLWSMVATLAGLVGDKYFFCKFPGHPMLPNLFTFLVGPSGLGKGTAINSAIDYVRPYKADIRMFVGRTTHSKWMEYITTPRGVQLDANGKIIPENGNCSTTGFLVSEELAFGLGSGDRAKEFLRMMTAAYTQTGRDFEEMTQSFGHHCMENPCMNWLAGSTKDWLLEAIGVQNLLSGFASRCVWVIEETDMSKMCSWPVFPAEFMEIKRYLEYRMELLRYMEGGELYLLPGARWALDRWYGGWADRATNDQDVALAPLYARGHDLALKLSMIVRIADMEAGDPERLLIRQHEVEQATRWVEHLMNTHYKKLLSIAYKSGDEEVMKVDTLGELIQKFPTGECTRSALIKKAHNKGMNAKAVEIGLRSLMEQGAIEMVPGPGGRGGYLLWKERLKSDLDTVKKRYLPKELQ